MTKTIGFIDLFKPVQEVVLTMRGKSADKHKHLVLRDGLVEWYVGENVKQSDIKVVSCSFNDNWNITGEVVLIGDKIHIYRCISPYAKTDGNIIKDNGVSLSIQAWLTGGGVRTGVVHNLYWGWIPSMVGRDGYPTSAIEEAEYEIGLSLGQNYISEYLSELEVYIDAPDWELKPCSSEDRWFNAKYKTNMRCKFHCPVAGRCFQNRAEA